MRALQQDCKGFTVISTKSESVRTSSSPVNQWTPATVTKTPVASQPRLYSVETPNGAQLVRNRRFIRPAQETAPIPAESVKCDESSSSERPRRVITRPKRLIETI